MGSDVITINVKWGKNVYKDINVNVKEAASEFKAQIYSLTNVEPQNQKIFVKGGILKDDYDLSQLQSGSTLMMMGTANSAQLKEPVEKVKFIEDMNVEEINSARKIPSGFENLGNTCYMNATLQCLLSMNELEENLKLLEGNISSDNQRNLLLAMRDLSVSLKGGKAVSPLVFLQSLRNLFPQYSQQSRGHFMQQDAQECFLSICSVLSNLVVKSDQNGSSFIKKFMEGSLETTMTCDEDSNEQSSSSNETFVCLSAHISQSVNYLGQALAEGLKTSIDKISPTLNRSAKYTKSSRISRLPKYLTVNFVRFCWRPEIQKKTKILRAVKFPMDLDMTEFCSKKLQEQMRPAQLVLAKQNEAKEQKIRENKSEKKKNATPEQDFVFVYDGPDTKASLVGKMDPDLLNNEGNNYHGNYELAAVLTHIGRDSDGGHYMAWVRKAPDSHDWWKFDGKCP